MLFLLACAEAPPTVLFVVLDTLRADRTSLCGHTRPTTPNLDALAATGTHTCRAYSPASWTLPSHASFFTGTTPTVHGLDNSAAPDAVLLGWHAARPLDAALPTLAEGFAAAGWHTAGISENPSLSERTGLTRGFASFEATRRFGSQPGWALKALQRRLTEAEGKGLFLFVNLTGAHEPLAAVPEGVGWVPATPAQDSDFANRDDPAWRYGRGEMNAEESAALLRARNDAYDYGVWRADRMLGAVLDAVRAKRGAPTRIVVTSDHGELLGEGGRLGHGLYLDEALVRVPLVVVGGPERLAEPFPGVLVHDLVAGKALGALPPVDATATPGGPRARMTDGKMPGSLSLATWEGTKKTLLEEGLRQGVDLAVDPTGQSLVAEPWQADAAAERFERWKVRHRSPVGEGAAELRGQLKALGYAD